ncbi:hypothetical protein J4Q44_G00094090 [Coregonus suidteri]|uniref:Peptide deformylase n=1 Tax=Coregonus suidteri TaxID=861788 RepID=A0AAN8RB10_9TELE
MLKLTCKIVKGNVTKFIACLLQVGVPVSSVAPSRSHSTSIKVGDPVLRAQAAVVDSGAVQGPEVQEVIRTMVKVMRKFECVGLSASQVGVPLRILALEFPERMLSHSLPAAREARGLTTVPLQIFINPQLRVLDGHTVKFQEACESISGFSATVPHYLSVEVSVHQSLLQQSTTTA